MSKTAKVVYVSDGGYGKNIWHEDAGCMALTEGYREIELQKIKPTYDACAHCVPDATGDRVSKPEFQCDGCGNVKKIGVQGARTLHGCAFCESLTNHERIQDGHSTGQ